MLQKLYLIHISDIDINAGRLYNVYKKYMERYNLIIKKRRGESYDVFIRLETKEIVPELFKWIGEQEYQINGIQRIERTLEDTYMLFQ